MPAINLNTASAVTGLNKRTLWRYIQDGRISTIRETGGGKTQVDLAAALALTDTRLDPELEALVLAADAGDAVAQCELALWLLEWERPGMAREWFAQSARGGYPNAMCWLGQDLLLGEYGPRDEPAGLLWLGQAAALGSPLGEALVAEVHGAAGQRARLTADMAALGALLDEATRRVLLEALESTADSAQP